MIGVININFKLNWVNEHAIKYWLVMVYGVIKNNSGYLFVSTMLGYIGQIQHKIVM